MKREFESFDRKKPRLKNRKRDWFAEEDYVPTKKELQNQYKRKQKFRKYEDWEA